MFSCFAANANSGFATCQLVSLVLNHVVQDVIEKGEEQPNLTIGILVSILVVFVTIIFRVLFGGKKAPPVSFV